MSQLRERILIATILLFFEQNWNDINGDFSQRERKFTEFSKFRESDK